MGEDIWEGFRAEKFDLTRIENICVFEDVEELSEEERCYRRNTSHH